MDHQASAPCHATQQSMQSSCTVHHCTLLIGSVYQWSYCVEPVSTWLSGKYRRVTCKPVGRFCKTPVLFYNNSTATFNIGLQLSGDIEVNPGPVKDPCGKVKSQWNVIRDRSFVRNVWITGTKSAFLIWTLRDIMSWSPAQLIGYAITAPQSCLLLHAATAPSLIVLGRHRLHNKKVNMDRYQLPQFQVLPKAKYLGCC